MENFGNCALIWNGKGYKICDGCIKIPCRAGIGSKKKGKMGCNPMKYMVEYR